MPAETETYFTGDQLGGGGGTAELLKNLLVNPGDLPAIDLKCTPGVLTAGIVARLESAGGNWDVGSRVLKLISADANAIPLEFDSQGVDITTVTPQNLVLDPSGYLQVGTGASPGHSPTGLFAIGSSEFDGVVYCDDNVYLGTAGKTMYCNAGSADFGTSCVVKIRKYALFIDGVSAQFGTANDSALYWSTQQTNNSLVLGLGDTSRTLIVCEKADQTTDFGLADQPHPSFVWMGSNAPADTTRWMKACHNDTDGELFTGKGGILFTARAAVPTLTGNSQLTFHLDQSGHNLVFTCKYSDGTTKTCTLAFD